MKLPSVHAEDNDFFVVPTDEEYSAAEVTEGGPVWDFLREIPLQAGEDRSLIKQSGLPETKFLSVIHVEHIKERNKPQQPVEKGSRAPFALPTVAGASSLEFVVPDKAKVPESGSRFLDMGVVSTSDGP